MAEWYVLVYSAITSEAHQVNRVAMGVELSVVKIIKRITHP